MIHNDIEFLLYKYCPKMLPTVSRLFQLCDLKTKVSVLDYTQYQFIKAMVNSWHKTKTLRPRPRPDSMGRLYLLT